MAHARATVRIVVLSTESCAETAAAWRTRLERELPGTAVSHVAAASLGGGHANGFSLDTEVAILFTGTNQAEALAALDATIHAVEHAASEASTTPGTRVLAVSDALGSSPHRASWDRLATAAAETELLPYLRGVLACAAALRESRRELSLLNRVVGSMRGELEERSEELQLAALVQRDFLPLPLPPLHGVRVATFYRPLAQVSGDVYHLEQVDDDSISVFLADAVGHGIPAALLGMAVCRSLETTERVHGKVRVLGPGETLVRANRRLIEHQRGTTRFATAVAGLLDCRTRRLRLAVAGHPPAILLRPGHEPKPIEIDGGLLGVFPDETYEELALELEPNDRLLLYSDGFEQAFFEGGSARHVDEFGKLAGVLDAEQLVEEIAARIDAQSGSLHQADDLTLLCISAEEVASLRVAA